MKTIKATLLALLVVGLTNIAWGQSVITRAGIPPSTTRSNGSAHQNNDTLAWLTDYNRWVSVPGFSTTDISYLTGLTSNVQTQLNTNNSLSTTGINPGHQHTTVAVATGTNTLTATYTPSLGLNTDPTKAADGTRVILTAAGANTGAVTFAPNGLAAKAVVKGTGTALAAGDIPGAGYQADLEYNLSANKWFLLNPTPAAGVPTAITAANEASDVTCFPAFFTDATGNLGPKTNTSLTFNASTGAFGLTYAIPATANNGLLSLGNGLYNGTAHAFVGSAAGTALAINTPHGFTGNMIDIQNGSANDYDQLFIVDQNGWVKVAAAGGIRAINPNASLQMGCPSHTIYHHESILAHADIAPNAIGTTSNLHVDSIFGDSGQNGTGTYAGIRDAVIWQIESSGTTTPVGFYYDLWINRTETSLGPAGSTHRLISAGTGGASYTEKFGVTNTGNVKATIPQYANNTTALAGGLTAGMFYRTGADPDVVCVVH